MLTTIIANHPALAGEVSKPPPAPPATSVPPPKPIVQQGLLIQAAVAQKPVVTVNGAEVKGLTVPVLPDGTIPSGDFVAKGTINLFGNKDLTAEFDIWNGPPPPGVTIGSAAPSVQRAVIKGSVKLSQLIPSLKQVLSGGDLSFKNLSVYHQNYLYDPSHDLGYDIDADLVIDSSLGSLGSILSKVLAVNSPTVHIHASLGPDQSWNAAPNVNSLTIRGSFVGHTYVATPGVQITSVGIRLVLDHSQNKTTHDAEVFGTLNLTLPGGSVVPLGLDYTLKDAGGTVQLSANLPSGVTWANPLGAQGFVLKPATFSSSLPLSDPWKHITLNIVAQFQYQKTIVKFTGSYIPGGACSLHANIQVFDVSSLRQLYEAVHHEPLKAPNVDVTFGSADLSIASGKGFTGTLTNVNIGGHGSGNAVLSFSSVGSVIHADLGSVRFGEVTVNSASIQLDLEPGSSAKSSVATIYGEVKFAVLETKVAVHLYPSAPNVVPKRTEWTVYAELTSSNNALALSKIEPKLKGTPFDLALKHVLFIAASQDNPDVGGVITGAYRPREGIQVFATFDEIPIFNSLTKSKVAGLILDASWSRTKGFSLDVLLPVARNLSLGRGITTTPVTLALDLIPSPIDKSKLIPSLQVSAGLYIPVAHSPKPLLFQMILTATETDATIAAELKGNWVNPFGISNEVVIGPDLLLQADLNYVTGLQGALFRGGLTVGKTSALVVVSVNEDPEKEMLYTEIHNLNFTDIVSFAEKLLHLKLPPPPADFLQFEEIKLYICPVGLTVQGVSYPPGFSFKSIMSLFGKHVEVSCEVHNAVLSIKGAVDDFDIGPLKVTGLDGAKQAGLQVQVGKNIQHLLLDGAITLYAESCALHFLVDVQPLPKVSFKFELKFTHLLTFEVDATLIGALNFKDLRKADFNFNADLEQHLLDYVHDEVLKLFDKAEKAAVAGIESAKKKVSDEEAALNKKIAQAKVQLKAAQNKWEAHRKTITETNSKIINKYNVEITKLQDAITRAERTYDAALRRAQAGLTNAQHDRKVKMQAAQNDLENAKRKAASGIDNAKKQVAAAQASLSRDFGAAEKKVEEAKHSVDSLQHQIDSTNRAIHNAEHGSLLDKLKIPALETELAGLEVAMQTARGVLDVAEAILKSANYVAAKAALEAAQKSLDLAKLAGPGIISVSQQALAGIDKATQAVLDGATQALKAVQSGSEKIVFDGAKAALTAYKRVNDAVFNAANKAIADLIKSVEYLAFQTATTALAVAQAATKSLDAAKAVLSGVEKGTVDVLKVGEAIVTAGTEALNITSIRLSGSLGKSAGGAGFKADIKGVALTRKFEIRLDLNPTKVENFLRDLFKELQKEVKAALHI